VKAKKVKMLELQNNHFFIYIQYK